MTIIKEVKLVLDMIKKRKYEPFIVGGAVRDFLLNKTPHDYDIATNALPEQIIEIFSEYRLVTDGIKHGTVGVIINHTMIEITTFRTDGKYIKNRYPEHVSFVKNLYEDLSRRDFTINALAYDDKVIDYFQGYSDLKKGIIRTVGDANVRFQEDGLRILRGLRFACQLHFQIEEKTSQAMLNNAELLKNISTERINSELTKMLLSDITVVIIPFFSIFQVIIPELKKESVEKNIPFLKNPTVGLATKLVFLLDGCEDKNKIISRLKYTNYIKKDFMLLNEYLLRRIPKNEIAIKKEMRFVGYDKMKIILKMQSLIYNDSSILKILEEVKDDVFLLKDLNIKGKDLINLNVEKKEIGNILNRCLDAVIMGKVRNDKIALLDYVKKIKA